MDVGTCLGFRGFVGSIGFDVCQSLRTAASIVFMGISSIKPIKPSASRG